MSADPPSSQTNRERFRHWITDVKVTSGNRDPSFRFSARMFIDDELVCNLSAKDNTRPLEWSGLLYCDILRTSTVALRLCKSVNGRPRFFNFPPVIISEADEESSEATLELAEAAWVVTIKSLTPAIANQLFPDELEEFDAIEGVYNSSESEATMKYLFKYALQFASIVAKALPESTAKVSFLIYMKAWELLDQQSELDDTARIILRGLTRIRDIVDIVSQASDSMLTAAMSQSKGAIDDILALLEDVSVYMFNRYTTNDLARIPPEGAEENNPSQTGSYLARLEELQLAFYSSWSPTGVSPDADGASNELSDASSSHDARIVRNEPTKTDWYEVVTLLKPINPGGYDLDQACMDGTRGALLYRIITWTQNRESPETFMWISGQAGMGKTSVATSLCQRLDSDGVLAGSFFCRRDDPSSNNPLALINNLVCEIAMNCPTYAHEVTAAIRANPKLCYSHLNSRYEGLVKRPLQKLERTSMPNTLVVIVDGLDECSDCTARGKTLEKLYEISRLVPWLKVIFTSRPVADIQQYFQISCTHRIVTHLHDYDATPDIRAYIEGELGQLAETESWPNGSINRLCTMAQGVFLWATVVKNYLKELALPASPRLQKVLANQKSPVTNYFDKLYTGALETAMGKNLDETRGAFLQCIGAILAISERQPLTAPDLQYLLLVAGQISQPTLEQTIINLRPLLLTIDGRRIRFHHSSFKCFITDASRSGQFHIRLDQYEAEPAVCCLRIMQRDLRFNICKLKTSHQLNSEVPDMKHLVDSHIGPALKYACTFWVDHFAASPTQALVEAIKEFMSGPQLMYWIEALSLLGQVDLAMAKLMKLAALELSRFNTWNLIVSWAKDAYRFILSFRDAISTSTPHLYVSALAFAPAKSLTALRMRSHFPNTITAVRGGDLYWHPCVKDTVHPHAIQSLSLSPDGRTAALGYPDGSLAVWDMQSGVCVSKSLVGHRDAVTCVIISPNGRLIASSSHDATVRVWGVAENLRASRVLSGHSGPVHSIAFSPNSSLIASGSSDRNICLWDPSSTRTQPIQGPYLGHSSRVTSVAFSPDGTKLVSGSWDKTIRVWSVDIGGSRLSNNPLVITGHSDSVTCVTFSPDTSKIASGSVDKTIQVWDTQSGAKSQSNTSTAKHSDTVTSVAFSPDGKYIASSSLDGAIQLWDASKSTPYSQPFGHCSPVNTLSFTPDGKHIVSGSTDMTARMWEIDVCPKPMVMAPLVGHSSHVYSVAITYNGTRIVSGAHDNTVRIWDAQTGAPVCDPLSGHSGKVNCVAVSPDGSRIVSCSDDRFLKLWDTSTRANIQSYQHGSVINSAAFSPSGAQIAFGGNDNYVYLWDVTTWKIIRGGLQGHSNIVFSVAFSPDGIFVASASADRTIIVWDTKAHARSGSPFSGHGNHVRSIAFSPCGTRLVSCSDDQAIRIWDRQTGGIITTLTGHSNAVTAVSFSPDGSCIGSGSYDNTVRLWDIKNGRLIGQPFTGHSNPISSIMFSPNGNYLISGSHDKTIRTWSIAQYYPAAEPDNQRPDTFSWPSGPYEMSPHPDHPGWISHDEQSLDFWLPAHYEQREKFLGVNQRTPCRPVLLNYSKFFHGAEWTKTASDSIRNSSE